MSYKNTFSKVITEAFRQAFQQLFANRLRTFLSLLGITIGIFCIIGVESAVDSLERDIRDSFEKLGEDVVYVSRFSWGEDPSQNWWKYRRRPEPSPRDYEAISERSDLAESATFFSFIGAKTAKFRNNSVERAFMVAITYEYGDIFKVELQKGRYFSILEYQQGASKVVIGHKVAESLFGSLDPIGREIKVGGYRMEVIGVVEPSGEDLISIIDYDEVLLVAFPFGKQLVNFSPGANFNGGVAVKASNREGLDELKDELTGILRAQRHIAPKEENDFALNTISIMASVLDNLFGVIHQLGLIIGIFAIFVGAFSVANIMFVSVKERTNIIGIKKALGAKQSVILLEFLVESTILCLLGGIMGLLFVILAIEVISNVVDFDMAVRFKNVLNGLIWATAIGLAAGLIPALQASRMDPVEAIRSK